MSNDAPPLPPPSPQVITRPDETGRRADAPIVDMRGKFERKTPQTPEEQAHARAFIDGKIDMIRKDPNLTEAEKAAAIADLETKR